MELLVVRLQAKIDSDTQMEASRFFWSMQCIYHTHMHTASVVSQVLMGDKLLQNS
jgi:hypothetical protein